MPPVSRKSLGVVTGGAFNAGLVVRLHADVSTEDLRIGDFCIVEGDENLYFSMVSDIELHNSDPRLPADPPVGVSPLIAAALRGSLTYATVQIKPMQMMPKGQETDFVVDLEGPQPVRTIPMQLSTLAEATEGDFRMVFGDENKGKQFFAMGTPLTMDIPICINLERLIERSNGIFGQSGTGKSFLVRLLLCGVIRSGVAVNLIFDMHDEYAFGKESEDGIHVRGLSQIFGRKKVLVYSLDKDAASRGGGRSVDRTIQIGLNQIEPEDVMLMAQELNLRGTSEATIGLLQDHFGADWLHKLVQMKPDEMEEFAAQSGAHSASLGALQRNMRVLNRRGYVSEQGSHVGRQPDHPARAPAVPGSGGAVRAEPQPIRQAAPAHDHHRRGAQFPQPRCVQADHFRDHCPRAAQVPRYPDGRRPAAQQH